MIVPRSVLDDVLAHAREEMPRECCGVLLGMDAVVHCSVRAANLADNVRRFLMDPRDHLRAIRMARQQQLEVLGFYHSHPQARAYPSETDVTESAYAQAVHLIVGFPTGRTEVGLFRLTSGAIVEEPLIVDDAASRR